MTPETPTAAGNTVNWAAYAEDARNFVLATSHAMPTAMRVWTSAWCEWATSAAAVHEQLARRWNEIVEEPGRGEAVLNQMRSDYKDYLLAVGGIPERKVLEFAQAMEATAKKGVPSAARAFAKAAEEAIAATVEGLNLIETTLESQSRPTRGPKPSGDVDELRAVLREKMSRLAAARESLRKTTEQSAG